MSAIQYSWAENPREVARNLTESLLDLYEESDKHPFFVALSGGATPASLFNYWKGFPELIMEKDIHFFWVDERMVPVESEDSNYGSAFRQFFGKVNFPVERLHPILYKSAKSVEEIAREYNELVHKMCADTDRSYLFDVAILGMGLDGHTSSLFPGQDLEREGDDYIPSIHPDNGVERVALSLSGIENCKSIYMHVLGDDKASRLAQVWNQSHGERAEEVLPAAVALRVAEHATIFTDIRGNLE